MKYIALLLMATTAALGEVVAVPEIDGNTAASAVAVVAGGLMILRARKK